MNNTIVITSLIYLKLVHVMHVIYKILHISLQLNYTMVTVAPSFGRYIKQIDMLGLMTSYYFLTRQDGVLNCCLWTKRQNIKGEFFKIWHIDKILQFGRSCWNTLTKMPINMKIIRFCYTSIARRGSRIWHKNENHMPKGDILNMNM